MPEETKATQAGAEGSANDAGQEEEKTYTQEEVDALLQKEGDKRVTEALKTRDKSWQDRLDKEKDEAVRLAKMSAEEREKASFAKEKEALEAERAKIAFERMSIEAEKDLVGRGLPAEFSAFLVADNADKTNSNISAFADAFESAVEKAVKEKIASAAPTATNASGAKTKSEIMDIKDPIERLNAIRNNPNVF